jgi:hypothetical protein
MSFITHSLRQPQDSVVTDLQNRPAESSARVPRFSTIDKNSGLFLFRKLPRHFPK